MRKNDGIEILISDFAIARINCENVHLNSHSKNREEILKTNSFETGRQLRTEHFLFPTLNKINSIQSKVLSLPKASLWIDMGAGQAVALQ